MKSERHSAIIKLIQAEQIKTQAELAQKLNEHGFNVTQATVSRDIKLLGLVKKTDRHNISGYALPTQHEGDMDIRYERIFKEGYVSMDMAQNILVIKTVSGMAMAVCAAIDAMNWNEVVGSIAGDDTIMCAVRTVEDTKRLMEKIKKIVKR